MTNLKKFFEDEKETHRVEQENWRLRYIQQHKDIQGVYLIRAENGITKIGKTTDINSRFASMKSLSPLPLELVGFIKTFDEDRLEKELHNKYSFKRSHGEWFHLDGDDISEILRHAS